MNKIEFIIYVSPQKKTTKKTASRIRQRWENIVYSHKQYGVVYTYVYSLHNINQ